MSDRFAGLVRLGRRGGPALCLLLVAGLVAVASSSSAADSAPLGAGGSVTDCVEDAVADDVAQALDLAASCGVPVEVASARGFSEQTWALPEGHLRSEVSAVPRWARNDAGDWVDVDASLVPQADGSLRSAATVSRVRLSGGGAGPFVTLTDPAGGALSLTWPGVLPPPGVQADTATYANVLPGVDLAVTAGLDGFSYRLVVHTPQAAANPALDRIAVGIAATGLAIAQNADGLVEARDAAGELVFASGPALAWDSSVPEASVGLAPQDSSPGWVAQMPIELDGGTLAVLPNLTGLATQGVEYPIFIDPPFVGSRLAWANVHQQQSSRGWTNDSAWPRSGGMRVGLCTWPSCEDSTGLWRSVVRFDTEALGGRHILTAAVKMTQTHTGGCGTYPLRLYQVSAFSSSVSWNGVNWASLLQEKDVASSNSTGCGTSYPNRPVTFNNSTVRGRVQNHADEGHNSISFGLRSGSETNRDQWRRISRDSLRFEVEHASYPQTPTGLSTDGKGCASSGPGPWLTTGKPKLTGRPRNADGKGYYGIQVRTAGGTTDIYAFRSGNVTVNQTVAHTVANTLSDRAYRWRMRTESPFSGVPASAYSAWCYFQVDTTPPPKPSATQLTADPGLGDPVQFRLTGSSDTSQFRYNLTGGASKTVTASGGSATVTVTAPTTSIDHQLQVWALDAAGNISARYDHWFSTGKALVSHPVGGWRFDGDWRDDSGNGRTLSPGPGVSSTADRMGRSGAAARFAAAPGGCLNTAGAVLDTRASFTVAAWVRMTDGGAAGTNPTVISQAGGYRSAYFLAWYRETGQWQFTMPSADSATVTWASAYSLAPAQLGRWTHVAGVHDAAARQVRLYVDGVLQEVAAAHPTMWNATGPMRIGCATRTAGAVSNEVAGDVDDVVAYPDVLTGEQLQDLMARGLPAGQVSWWPLRGNGADTGPAGSPLTVPGTAAWVPDAFGRAGSALRLDGQSCASTAGPVLRTDDSFTVAAWARVDGAAAAHTVLSQAGVNGTSMRLRKAADNRWGFIVMASDSSSATWHQVYAPAAATTGGWQHLTGVYDASGTLRLYVDGVLQGEAAAPATMWRGGGGLNVGCAATTAGAWDYLDGAVHDVRAWRGSATPEQVRAVAVKPVSFWGLDADGQDGWGDHDLTLVGEYEWVDDRFGFPESAFGLALDGTGWADTAGPVLTTDESFTVSAWAKLDNKGGIRTVVAQAGAEVASFNLSYDPGADRWQLSMASEDAAASATWQRARSIAPPAVGQWYHLAGVFDLGANRISLYVNGQLQATAAGPAEPWHVAGELMIGSAGNTTGDRWNPMVGSIDMVRAYSGVLDERRIADQGVVPTGFLAGGGQSLQ
jgi:hypothetical protein